MATSSVGRLDYDENLLESAPAATKAQLQSGYNPDLLQDKPTPSMSSRQDLTLPTNRDADAEKQLPPPKTPFYRTTKGILIILVVAAVVIAAVVGGAVGGTRNHHSSAIAVSGQQGQSAGQAGQSAGQAGGVASAASGASTQSTVGAASSTVSGQSQAEQTQSATSSSSANLGGGPIAGFPSSFPPLAVPSQVLNQEVGLLANIGH